MRRRPSPHGRALQESDRPSHPHHRVDAGRGSPPVTSTSSATARASLASGFLERAVLATGALPQQGYQGNQQGTFDDLPDGPIAVAEATQALGDEPSSHQGDAGRQGQEARPSQPSSHILASAKMVATETPGRLTPAAEEAPRPRARRTESPDGPAMARSGR